MAKRYLPARKIPLYMTFSIVSGITLVHGLLSIHMIYLYISSVIYYFSVCKGNKIACCYSIAGTVTCTFFILIMKFVDSLVGMMLGLIIACFMGFVTDRLDKCDWKDFFNLCDFDFSSLLSSSPIESSIQFKYDQHVIVDDAPPIPEPEIPKKESETRQKPPKKKYEKSLLRKEKKAAAKKQAKDPKTPNSVNEVKPQLTKKKSKKYVSRKGKKVEQV